MRTMSPLLAQAGRGLAFSHEAAGSVRPLIESIPALAPAERLLRLMAVLSELASDRKARPIAGAAADRQQVASPDQARIERVLDHIHGNYRSEVGVEALADVAALSPSGFHRLFRRHTRLTLTDYIAELRIGQACALLVNSSLPVAHIADEVGYRNLANFNRRFRSLKGMTPRDFRRSFAR
jgi:AraC-like DNA-binding protein